MGVNIHKKTMSIAEYCESRSLFLFSRTDGFNYSLISSNYENALRGLYILEIGAVYVIV